MAARCQAPCADRQRRLEDRPPQPITDNWTEQRDDLPAHGSCEPWLCHMPPARTCGCWFFFLPSSLACPQCHLRPEGTPCHVEATACSREESTKPCHQGHRERDGGKESKYLQASCNVMAELSAGGRLLHVPGSTTCCTAAAGQGICPRATKTWPSTPAPQALHRSQEQLVTGHCSPQEQILSYDLLFKINPLQ